MALWGVYILILYILIVVTLIMGVLAAANKSFVDEGNPDQVNKVVSNRKKMYKNYFLGLISFTVIYFLTGFIAAWLTGNLSTLPWMIVK